MQANAISARYDMATGSRRGQATAVGGVIGAMILIVVGVALFPAVNDQIASLENLTSSEQAIVDVLTVIFLVGLFAGAAVHFGLM